MFSLDCMLNSKFALVLSASSGFVIEHWQENINMYLSTALLDAITKRTKTTPFRTVVDRNMCVSRHRTRRTRPFRNLEWRRRRWLHVISFSIVRNDIRVLLLRIRSCRLAQLPLCRVGRLPPSLSLESFLPSRWVKNEQLRKNCLRKRWKKKILNYLGAPHRTYSCWHSPVKIRKTI